jgi:hypothetical protein
VAVAPMARPNTEPPLNLAHSSPTRINTHRLCFWLLVISTTFLKERALIALCPLATVVGAQYGMVQRTRTLKKVNETIY